MQIRTLSRVHWPYSYEACMLLSPMMPKLWRGIDTTLGAFTHFIPVPSRATPALAPRQLTDLRAARRHCAVGSDTRRPRHSPTVALTNIERAQPKQALTWSCDIAIIRPRDYCRHYLCQRGALLIIPRRSHPRGGICQGLTADILDGWQSGEGLEKQNFL